MAKIHAETEIESSATPVDGQRDAGQVAPEPEAQQAAGEPQPWGSEAAALAPEARTMKRMRAKLLAGAALAGGGALATIRKRKRARAQQGQRRSLMPARLRRTARKREPTNMELLRSKLWRR